MLSEVQVPHPLERMPRQQTIRTGLMTFTNLPVYLKRSSQPVQTAVQSPLAELHHVLHVVHSLPEKRSEQPEKVSQRTRKLPAREDLHEVTEIVRAVERHPAHRLVADQPRRHHQLREPLRFNPFAAVTLEIDPVATEELDRILRVRVAIHVEVAEIELPDEAAPVDASAEIREVSVGVGESDADLDEAEDVDVGFEKLVEITRVSTAENRWLRLEDHAGKLRVHGNVGEIFDDSADEVKLRDEIVSPDLTNHDRSATIDEIYIWIDHHRHRLPFSYLGICGYIRYIYIGACRGKKQSEG